MNFTDMRRNPLLQRELQVIAEDAEVLSMEDQAEDIKQRKAKRATMVFYNSYFSFVHFEL